MFLQINTYCDNYISSPSLIGKLNTEVELLQTVTLKDRVKCPSCRGVNLIEVLKNIDI